MRKSKNGRKAMKHLMIIMFTIYIILIVWVVIFKLQFSAFELDYHRSINLIPFYYSNEVGIGFHLKEVFLNCLMFLPFGIYMKAISDENSSRMTVLLGALFSIILEVIQYIFAIGATDATDVITNTCGVAMGVLMYDILLKIIKRGNRLNVAIISCSVLFMGISIAAIIALIVGN